MHIADRCAPRKIEDGAENLSKKVMSAKLKLISPFSPRTGPLNGARLFGDKFYNV
jgi:hypothetical protein